MTFMEEKNSKDLENDQNMDSNSNQVALNSSYNSSHDPSSITSLVKKQNNFPQYIPGGVPTSFPDADAKLNTNTISISNSTDFDDPQNAFYQPANEERKYEYVQRAYELPRRVNLSKVHKSLKLDPSPRIDQHQKSNRPQSLSLCQPNKLVYNRTSENDFVTNAMNSDSNTKKKEKNPKKEKEKEKKKAKAKKTTLKALDFFTDNVVGWVAPVPFPDATQIDDMIKKSKEKKKQLNEKENKKKDIEIKNDDDDHITDPNFITEKELDSEGREIDSNPNNDDSNDNESDIDEDTD